MAVDQERIERDLAYLKSFMSCAWHRDLEEVEALVERLRLDLMLNKQDAPARHLYNAAVHFLEDAVEHRHRAERKDRRATRLAVADYIRTLLEAWKD